MKSLTREPNYIHFRPVHSGATCPHSISSIGDFRQTVDVPDFAGATMEDFQNEDFDQTESTIELDIDDEELVLDEPAFLIQPVAVYW